MSFALTDAELDRLKLVPESDLAELAVELDLLLEAEIDRRRVLEQCIVALLERARSEGLPFSKYDADDLDELDPAHRGALASLIGLGTNASTRDLLKAGARTARQYSKTRPRSPTVLLLPVLLAALARAASEAATG